MLVWNAMLSITPMMSAIFLLLSLMPPMVWTTWPTTLPPRVATSEALTASELAWRALSAFCFTMLVSSSMLEAVSSSELACSSVRCDRSALPAAISCAAERTESLPRRICCSTAVSLSAKALNERAICATSSWPSAGRRLVRSPLPEPMSSIASRIIDRRRNARAVIAPTMAAATSATTTSTPIDVVTSERMPAVASDLSSATTRPQSVPCTPWR